VNSSISRTPIRRVAFAIYCFRHLLFGDGQGGNKAGWRFGVRFDIKHVNLGSLGTRDRL
jgi:hypothetical protein